MIHIATYNDICINITYCIEYKYSVQHYTRPLNNIKYIQQDTYPSSPALAWKAQPSRETGGSWWKSPPQSWDGQWLTWKITEASDCCWGIIVGISWGYHGDIISTQLVLFSIFSILFLYCLHFLRFSPNFLWRLESVCHRYPLVIKHGNGNSRSFCRWHVPMFRGFPSHFFKGYWMILILEGNHLRWVTTWDQLGFPHSNTGRFPKGIDKPRHTRPHWSKASSSLAEIMETCTGWPLVDHWLIDVNWCWLYFMWMDYMLIYLHDLYECWWMDMNGLKLIQQRSSYQDALVLEQIHVNAPSTLIRGLWV